MVPAIRQQDAKLDRGAAENGQLIAIPAELIRLRHSDLTSNQCALGEHANMPGAAVYERQDGRILRRGRAFFGPGDLYSPVWHFLALAGLGASDWTPQFHYWRRPAQLDDGGENLRD